MPKIGETKKADNFLCASGGKGANVVTASSRLGSKTAFICKVYLSFKVYLFFSGF